MPTSQLQPDPSTSTRIPLGSPRSTLSGGTVASGSSVVSERERLARARRFNRRRPLLGASERVADPADGTDPAAIDPWRWRRRLERRGR